MNKQFDTKDLAILTAVIIVCLLFAVVQPIQVSFLVGESMEPTIHGGDIIVYTQYAEIAEGDIVVFTDPDKHVKVGHRVVQEVDEGYITIGDNNEHPDPYVVTDEDLEGKVLYHFSTPLTL